jgi:hypothetical protein
MKCLNMNRRQTISGCFTELEEAGAIQRKRRFHNTSLTFVDLNWLLAHKRTDDTESVTSVEEATQSVTSVPTDNVTTPRHVEGDNHLTQSVTRSTSSLIYGDQRRDQRETSSTNLSKNLETKSETDMTSHVRRLETPETQETLSPPTPRKTLQENPPPAPERCHRTSYGSAECEFCGARVYPMKPELCPKRHPENTVNAGVMDRHQFKKSTSVCDKCGLSYWDWAESKDPARYKNYAFMPCGNPCERKPVMKIAEQEVFAVDDVKDTDGLEEEIPYE